MSLPEFLSGSYRRYKEDTTAFTTWLSQAAAAVGWKVPKKPLQDAEPAKPGGSSAPSTNTAQAQSGRLKGKARKAAKAAAQQSTATSSGEPPKKANAVGVQGIGSVTPKKDDVKGPSADESKDGLLDLRNQFEALDVEYVSDQFALASADASKSGSATKNEVFELEADPAWEDAFICYCFFEDLHSIQDTLKDVWKKYQDEKLDLVSATMTTNAAIELVQHAEKDLLDATSTLHAYKRPYDRVAMSVFYAETLRNGRDPDEYLSSPESLEVMDLDDFIYLPTARVLMKAADMAKYMDKINWPVPVPQMRFGYIARPELLELPKYEKLEKDRTLTQLLHEVALIHKMREFPGIGSAKVLPDVQDGFSKSMERLWTKGEVSAHNVFASRIMLDIIEITSDQPSFHKDLLQMGKHTQRNIEFQIHSDGSLGTGDTRWLTKDQNTIMDIYQLTEMHIPYLPVGEFKKMMMAANKDNLAPGYSMDDAPPEVREAIREGLRKKGLDPDDGPSEEHKRNAKKLDLRPIPPAPEPNFAVTHNPLLCGMMALQLDVLNEEAGVALSNHHLSIFATAHLYNAIRQLRLTQISWPDLERVMDLHAGPIFANDVPDTPEKFFARMAFRIGSSARPRKMDKEQKLFLHVTPATKALREYIDGKQPVQGVIRQVDDQLQEHMPVASSANAATTIGLSKTEKKSTSHSLRRRRLTPLQSVEALQSLMPAILPDITIDYIALTKTCNALMRAVRQRIQEEMGTAYPSLAHPGDSNDHGFLVMVLKILEETKVEEEALQRKKKGEAKAFEGGEQLRLAAETMEEFWSERAIGVLGDRVERVLSM
ncbi:uncharacterized protein LTHEOB_1600 [Lasiodiplodia theobromae]|uniref:uncharacterized protein n=1 Tax=Lasiodiplodia theobromae TaxID=45133 RepID=UPI0015C3311F|nr:uncharacterized protein LTHEOB_1600 [Lasiodiplodia theobromae]KAF4537409.1 hypothetical protein LTHEOB_1600 [Lasiodiplodia theobromae]